MHLGQGATGGRQRLPKLGLVVGEAGVNPSQVAEQLAGQLPAAGSGRRGRPYAVQQRSGLGGGQVAGRAAGEQVPQQPMQPVEDAGAFAGQVVAAFGQQTQDRGLVFGGHRTQGWAVQGNLSDAGRIGGVALAPTADTQQPRPGGQAGRHVQDLLTGRRQLLGDGSSQPVGALNGEPRRPPSGPGRQLAQGADVHQQPTVAQRRAGGVNSDGGE
jgi:hypothetical protein